MTIVTVFGKTNFLGAHGFQARWQEVTAIRRAEDEAFAAEVDANLISCERPEAALRLRPSIDAIFGAVEAFPAELPNVLADILHRVKPGVILAPAALGGHVDHRVVRALAPDLARSCGAALAYYEDLPYAGWMAPGDIPKHVAAIRADLEPLTIRLNAVLPAKLSSMLLYRTQVTPDMVATIRAYALLLDPTIGAERLWILDGLGSGPGSSV